MIDFFGLSQDEARLRAPEAFQRVLDRVKPERDRNRRESRRLRWWLFSENMVQMRAAVKGLHRFIATPETSKHRVFVFVPGGTILEHPTLAIGLSDSSCLGILSSRTHVRWALATGGRLGVGNDPRYNKRLCFETFPFPECRNEVSSNIRDLGEELDAHRKRQQALHPSLTLTSAYNVLEILRAGEVLTAKERAVHEQGLVSVLAKIHDQLDERCSTPTDGRTSRRPLSANPAAPPPTATSPPNRPRPRRSSRASRRAKRRTRRGGTSRPGSLASP